MCDRLMSPYRRLERLVTIQSAWHAWHHVPCLETRAANVVAWVCASCAPGVAGSASVGALPWRSGPESSRWCATIRTAAGLRRRTSTACRSRSSHTVHRRLDATYRSSATGIVVSATRLACWLGMLASLAQGLARVHAPWRARPNDCQHGSCACCRQCWRPTIGRR